MDTVENFILLLWIFKWHILFVAAVVGAAFWYESRHRECCDV